MDKSIRKFKSISSNILEVTVYILYSTYYKILVIFFKSTLIKKKNRSSATPINGVIEIRFYFNYPKPRRSKISSTRLV